MNRHGLLAFLFVSVAVRCFGLDPAPPGTHVIVVSEPADRASRADSKVHLPAGEYIPIYGSKHGIYYLAPDVVVTKVLWVTKHLRGGLFVANDPAAGPEFWADMELGPTRYPLSAPVPYTVSEKHDVPVPPEPRVMIPPSYPFELRRAGVTGSATIEFDVTVDGDVENARVVSATRPEFGEAARKAISKSKFRPAKRDGHPIRAHLQLPITFDLGK